MFCDSRVSAAFGRVESEADESAWLLRDAGLPEESNELLKEIKALTESGHHNVSYRVYVADVTVRGLVL